MKWGIKQQVLLLALTPTVIISTLLGAYFISTRLEDLRANFLEGGKANALKLAPASEYGVFFQNKAQLQNLAMTALHELKAQSVSFYTAKGAEIVSAGKSIFKFQKPKEEEALSPNHTGRVLLGETSQSRAFIVPISIFKEFNDVHSEPAQTEVIIGWLVLELETKSLTLRKYQILFHTGMMFLLGLCCSGVYALQLGRNVTRPILELAQAVERIKRGELNTRVQISSYRELEILGSGINTMAQTLENAHNQLQNKIDQATLSLRRTLETIEVQNIELEIARRAAENANKIKSEFLADMSHEIRTPLNGVIGFINLLQKTELNQKQQDYITTIKKSASNLLAIINDILDFSKIEAGKLRIERTPMDIRDCIDETLNLLAPHAHEKKIALIPLIYSDVPTLLVGDPLRIKQIITNLVNNAIKFTDQGSVIVRVMLEHEINNQLTIRVNVTDTGVGISKEEQKLLFQAFNQTKIGTTREFGGTGLGLVICKKLVEQMGGTIGIESELQKGATFWFTFQAEKHTGSLEQTESVTHISGQEKTSLDLAVTSSTTSIEKKPPVNIKRHSDTETLNSVSLYILAVDDNPENLKLITVLLEDMGATVTPVESGEKAIEAVRQRPFDLILMDIRMPHINGIDASHAIRRLEATHQRKPTPIIALTAHALASEKKSLLAAGIDDYLAKPLGEQELKEILVKWIKKAESPKIIDWELGKKLAGGREELAKEFLEKLIASLPEEKALIAQDYKEHNWKMLRDHVHKLHGACCYCGVPQLKDSAHQLEVAAAGQDVDAIKLGLDKLNLAIDVLLEEAKRLSLYKS